ncbi:MAG TPA: YlbF family regulator [Gemmatimonadaceae bacterium]|nr:YlbF family regulator [Gemmatimonadaceae bacterium]
MLEEKARDLGRVIGQSAEYQAVKRASAALNEDREALTLIRRMEEIRLDAERMIARGEAPTPEMEQELDGLLARVQGSPVYQQMAVAQENFDKLMSRVNEVILEGIQKGATSSIITL